MITVAVVAYMCIVLFAAFFLKTATEFWILAILVGMFQGGVQALSRSYFGKIIPKEKSNEYYGFFDIFGRYASVMGTLLVSVVTSLTGDPSLGSAFHRDPSGCGFRFASKALQDAGIRCVGGRAHTCLGTEGSTAQ